jgi:hypothetical protein
MMYLVPVHKRRLDMESGSPAAADGDLKSPQLSAVLACCGQQLDLWPWQGQQALLASLAASSRLIQKAYFGHAVL